MSGEVLYLDSSALVKLVMRDNESDALSRFLDRYSALTSSALARVEVLRAVRPWGPVALERGRDVLLRMRLLRLDGPLLDAAGTLEPWTLRSLDAIHLASALTFGTDLDAVVTYDRRMAAAASSLGMRVEAPA